MERLSDGARQALLTELVEEMRTAKSWAGETHQQKCVYILQEMFDVPLGFDYVLYKHGPFSFDLRDELAKMRADLVLDIEPRTNYGPSYKPGQHASRIKRRFNPVTAKYRTTLRFVAAHLSIHNVAELEQLVTAYFVSQQHPGVPVRQIAQQIVSIKPHISTEDAMDAFAEIMKIEKAARRSRLIANQS